MNCYNEQAEYFLKLTKTQLIISYLGCKPQYKDDTVHRDVYRVTLKNPKGECKFNFVDSPSNTYRRRYSRDVPMGPSEYSILSKLVKIDPGSLEDFSFGYSIDSSKLWDTAIVKEIYESVKKQYTELSAMYSEQVMEMLQEIQ